MEGAVSLVRHVPDFQDSSSSYNVRIEDFTLDPHVAMEHRILRRAVSTDDATSSSSTNKDDDKTSTTTAAGKGKYGDSAADKTTIVNEQDDDDSTSLMNSANKTSILPPEPKDQPKAWPSTVLIIFLLLAAVLLGLTLYRNCRSRSQKSQYTEVPATSIVV